MELGRIGIWRSRNRGSADAAGRIEQLGFGALWIGGSPSVDQVRPYLEASSRMPVITGILNVWQHDPADVAAAHARITAEHPEPLPARHRRRPPRGDQRLHAPADGDARVLRRPRRRRDAGAEGRAPGRRARPEDARSRHGALARHASLLHHDRAHALRARAPGGGRAGRARGRRRARPEPGDRPPHRARVRHALPRALQLHEEPPGLRLHRGGHPRTAARTA